MLATHSSIMMADPRSRCICLFSQMFLWSLLLLRTCAGSECKGAFDFPELNTTVWTAKENTTITLNFRLKYSNCELPDNVTIILKKKNKESGRSADFCTIRQRNGLCRIPLVKNGCGCDGLERGLYQLKRTVNRSDNAVWIWTSADDERVEDKELIFNILYPAEVQNLTINGDQFSEDELVAEQDDALDVICLFENGNPPVTARLLDRHGVEMEGSIYSSGQILYRFPAVGCQDAGLIRCEAPGASHNGSVMLLVKCPPEFEKDIATNVTALSGQPLEMNFPFRTFTKNATVCHLRQLAAKSDIADPGAEKVVNLPSNDTCLRSCVLVGTPPDLTLTVILENVTEQDFGRWEVELTNDVGNDQLDFYILEHKAKELPPSHKFTWEEIAIFTSVGTVVLIIMCICIATCRKKGSGQKQMNRDSQTRNDGDVILGVGPTARATNQREPTSQHPDDYMNPLEEEEESFILDPYPGTSAMTGGSTRRVVSDPTHTFRPFRPPSTNFRILRMSRRLLDRARSRTSQMPFE